MDEQIVVTGLGLISALGNDAANVWKNVCAGKTGITDLSNYTDHEFINLAAYTHQMGAVIPNYKHVIKQLGHSNQYFDRGHQLAIIAAHEAYRNAGLDITKYNKHRAGIYIGTSVSGIMSGQKYQQQKIKGHKIDKRYLYNYPIHILLKRLTDATNFLGVKNLISTACTASLIAIATAVQALRLNQADIILVGGVDPFTELSFAGFNSMNNVSSQGCAPFSLPTGLSLGEGAGMLIIERREHAIARNAKIYAEISEYAMSADAWHMTSPEPSGRNQKDLLTSLLHKSGMNSTDIDYLNAHGTGTPGNDAVEAKGIRLAFQDYAVDLPISSTKGATGHTLGAAGAIEAILTILAVYHDMLPPTANFTTVRPQCDLNHVINVAKPHSIQAAITQNFAFGGNNTALLIKKDNIKNPATSIRNNNRVVITGMGLLSPIGNSVSDYLHSLTTHILGINDITQFCTAHLGSSKGGVIENFNSKNLTNADTRRFDRITAFTVCAAETLLKHAGYKINRDNANSIGMVVGSCMGGLHTSYCFNEPIAYGDISRLNPGLFPNTVLNAGAGAASIHLKIKGPNLAINIGQASGLRALSMAYDFVRLGELKAVVSGGVDDLLQHVYTGFSDAKLIAPIKGDTEASCPFDKRRNGMVLGEGAAFFMVESLESALARNATIYAEILGHHCVSYAKKSGESPSQMMAQCMQQTLANSQINASTIDYISAGAMASLREDKYEADAINTIFESSQTPTAAFSSVVGVSAATAPLSLAAILLGMKHQFAPAQLDFQSLGSDINLNIITPRNNCLDINHAMINSISLGGIYTSMVIKKYTE